MTTKYYTLLIRSAPTSPWEIEFGAYDKSDVYFERAELRDGHHNIPYSRTKIIITDGRQQSIQKAVEDLNGQLQSN